MWEWKQALITRLAHERLTIHAAQAQVLPTHCGIPWLGFVVHPTHRLLKRRNAVNFTRRLESHLDAYQAGLISFAELDAGVQGWINHVRRRYLGAAQISLRDASDPGRPRLKAGCRAAGEVSPAPPPESEYPD